MQQPLANYNTNDAVFRRLFNWFAFILFLFNGFAGFVLAIVRVAINAGLSLLLLFRLDTMVFPRGFDTIDFGEDIFFLNIDTVPLSIPGHRAFLGFFYLYYSYNNAVMHCFVHLLKGRRRRRLPSEEELVRQEHFQEDLSSPLLGTINTCEHEIHACCIVLRFTTVEPV